MAVPHIELIARRDGDPQGGSPDYLIYARDKVIGRIYRTHFSSTGEGWFWGVNAVTYDTSVGGTLHGYASDFAASQANVRRAFDAWLTWGLAMPVDDLKFPRVDADLRATGAR